MSEPGPDEQVVAWQRTPYRAPVLDAEGGVIGTTASLLGDEAADIFHGLAVKQAHGHAVVEVPAGQVAHITTGCVYTTVPPAEVSTLQPYREQHWYHLGWGGLFRKHPEWDGD
ncbi:MAG TPA: hypothetical protein VMW49_04535 [Candidatus Dormibacteraeota bacterium]|nr:hypothetical protein [Candidatus Dormibacteraeota bacterium]